MKLAEALIARADHQRRLEQLKQRLMQNARVQEGDEAAENPAQLLQEIERVAAQLEELIQRINRTNAATSFDGEMTVTDALASRDILRLRHEFYRGLAQAASAKQDRFSRFEVKFESTVDVGQIQQQADDLAREHRDLDTRVQELNWRTELLD
jgi:hypothetical protein